VADGFLADLDADACLADEPRRALDDRDPGGLQEAGDAADQLVDRCGAALLKVPEVAGAGVRCSEQSQVLAGDASLVEADAAEAGPLHQGHVTSVLGGADRAHVSGRTAAEDQYVTPVGFVARDHYFSSRAGSSISSRSVSAKLRPCSPSMTRRSKVTDVGITGRATP